MNYESVLEIQSKCMPGVSYRLAKISFGRRVELTIKIQELAQKVEFLNAGADPKEKIEAALLAAEIERVYVLWGLKEIGGLELDGTPATPESLTNIGPEPLFREVLSEIKAECGLTEAERKN